MVITLFISCSSLAQITITSGSKIKVKGEFSTRGSVNNASDETDLSEATLVLTGANQTLSSSTPLVPHGLSFEGW
jgi:hypothetical protein